MRSIVKFIKNSTIVSDELRKNQTDAGKRIIKFSSIILFSIVFFIYLYIGKSEGQLLKLILDIKTRCNSICYMIERFLTLSPILSGILLTKTNAPDMLLYFSRAEFTIAHYMLYKKTEVFSTSRDPLQRLCDPPGDRDPQVEKHWCR